MPLFGTERTGIDQLLLFLVLAGGIGHGAGRTGIDELLLFILLSGGLGRGYA